jgi:hypothetical protein
LIYEATVLLCFFLGLFLYGYWTVCHKTAQDGISSQDWGLGVQRLLFVVNEGDDSQYSKILAHGKGIDPSQRETKSDHTSVGLSTWRSLLVSPTLDRHARMPPKLSTAKTFASTIVGNLADLIFILSAVAVPRESEPTLKWVGNNLNRSYWSRHG